MRILSRLSLVDAVIAGLAPIGVTMPVLRK